MKLNNTKTFPIKHELDTGEIVEGTFQTKRLSIKDRSQIGVKKSQLSSGLYCVRDDQGKATGQGIDEDTDYLNSMIAHLEVSLTQKPTWWDLDEVADIGLVQKVYGEVMDFEMSFFRSKNREDSTGSGSVGEGNGSSQHSQTGSTNHPTPVVGEEVQASLDA